jgi:phospholipid transport system substrate-binding protein
MYFRRFVLGVITTLPMLGLAPLAQAQVAPHAAKAFIQSCGQQLVTVVNDPGSATQKTDQLQTLVNQMVAVDTVGDFVLGRYRFVATPNQHTQFLALFHQLLSYKITNPIKPYNGIGFTVNRAAVVGADTVVDTTITRPHEAPADVGWAVNEVDGSPKIVDVIVAGASMRVTTRNEYGLILADNGGQVSALLSAMQSQIDRITSTQ